MQKNLSLSIILLILLGIIWGSGYSIARYATTHGVSPLGYAFWQTLGPAIITMIIAKSRGMWFKFEAKHWLFFIVCGLFGIAIPNSNMYFAASHLPANLLALIINTVPIIIYPLALITKQEKFNFIRIIGILIGVIGLLFIILPKTALPTSNMLPHVLIALISPFSFAITAVYIARFGFKEINAFVLSCGMLVTAAIMLFPIVYFTKSVYRLSLPFNFNDYLIMLEIVLSSVGYVIFFKLIKIAGPVFYSLVNGVVALTGLCWGWFIFRETLNYWEILSAIFIISSIIIVSFCQSKTNQT